MGWCTVHSHRKLERRNRIMGTTLKERYAEYKVNKKTKKEIRDKERKEREDRLRKETLDAEYARGDAKKAKDKAKADEKEADKVAKIEKSNAKGLKKWDKKRAKDAKKAKRKADADATTAMYQKQSEEKKAKKIAKRDAREKKVEQRGIDSRAKQAKQSKENKEFRAGKWADTKKKSDEGKARRKEKFGKAKALYTKFKGYAPWSEATEARSNLEAKGRALKSIEKQKDATAESDNKKEEKRIKAENKEVFKRKEIADAEKQKKSDELFAQETVKVERKADEYKKKTAERAKKGEEVGTGLHLDAEAEKISREVKEKAQRETVASDRKADADKQVKEKTDTYQADLKSRYAKQKESGELVDDDVKRTHQKALSKADEYMASTNKQEKKDFLGRPPKDVDKNLGQETGRKTVDPRQVKQDIADMKTLPTSVASQPPPPATTPGQTTPGYDATAKPVGGAGAVAGAGYGALKTAYGAVKASNQKASDESNFLQLGEFGSIDELNAQVSGVSKQFKSPVTQQSYKSKIDQDKAETAHYKRVDAQNQHNAKLSFNEALKKYSPDTSSPTEKLELYYMGVMAGETDKVLDSFNALPLSKKKEMENKMYDLATVYQTEGATMAEFETFKRLLMVFGKGTSITKKSDIKVDVRQEVSSMTGEMGQDEIKYFAKVTVGGVSIDMPIDEAEYALYVSGAKDIKTLGKKNKKPNPMNP